MVHNRISFACHRCDAHLHHGKGAVGIEMIDNSCFYRKDFSKIDTSKQPMLTVRSKN